MNILFASSYLPHPLFSGGHIRLYNLMKQLSKRHSITLVCEKRVHQTEEDKKAVEKVCDTVITVERKKQWSLENIIKTGLSTHPFLITGHTNNEMRDAINQLLLKEKFDIIHAETFYIMQNIPQTLIPIVLVEHNIEYLVYKRYINTAPWIARPLLQVDIMKLKTSEKEAWQRATKLVAVSEDEKKLMERSDVAVVPNGVDIDMFPFKEITDKKYHSLAKGVTLPEKEILFIGDFRWVQNRDTARWIIQDIWPYLLRAVEGEIKIKLRIVGKSIPEDIKRISTYDSIVFDENAPKETALIFQQADVLLAPIRVGGGTSYKILEAMATGIPVVTTTLGAEGIIVEDNESILIADDVQKIVEKTSQILRNDEAYKKITKNARKIIEDKYEWKVITKELEEVYKSVLKK